MTDHAHQIICGPQPALSVGQRMKSFGTLAIVALLIGGAWKFGPAIRAQAKLLYWQQQCTNYSMEGDWVAYEEDPAAAAELAKATGADRKHTWSESDFFTITDGSSNKLLGCYLIPRCATELQSRVAGAASCGPIVFLHSRRAKNGAGERLVQIELSLLNRTIRRAANAKNTADDQVLKILVIDPAGPISPAKVLTSNGWWHRGLSATPFGKLRFFAGQPDPTDASHFTIDYHDDIAKGTLDGWLQGDDTVQISVRDVFKLP